jgi:ZIP family zinc transporter
MAVGIVCAGWLYGNEAISFTGALALALGIAIQNFPEGAIVSMPLLGEGLPKGKTFLYGVLSGIVEPIGSLLVIAASALLIPTMPYLLSFAAGAMIYVVVEELIPEMSEGEHSNVGTVCFALGFILMMALDIGLG